MKKTTFLAAATALALTVAASALAQDAQPQADAGQDGNVLLELNKLEPSDKGCKVYFVLSNTSPTKFDKFLIDLVMFQADGVIGNRIAVPLAPFAASKRTIKEFVLTGIACDRIGSFLVNDVLECQSDTGPVDGCLARLKVNSLNKVEISK